MRFSELDGAAVGVWGAGREIRSFARQLARRLPAARIEVAAFDTPPADDPRAALMAPQARIVTGAEILPALASCEVVVRSPGVSTYRPELRALADSGVPVTTATALWLAQRGGAGVIAITGTKGKSTTASLAHRLARAAGRPAELAGNIGVPALDLLDREPYELAIVELSSYQIADLDTGPEVAVLTNVFREHSDWHGSEAAYRADKLRLFALPGVAHVVLSAREPEPPLPPAVTIHRYGSPEGWDTSAEGLTRAGELVLSAAQLPLAGTHNALNLCAALTALEAMAISPPALPEGLAGFQALPHRLETVAERGGVTWVDDSISTTPESTLAALASFPGRELVLIAGGQDRGQDYAELARALAGGAATVIGVPSTGERLIAAARAAGASSARAIAARDLEDAVARARVLASGRAVVLLSPAAPSFDCYRDFEERGERFRALAARSR